MTRISGYYPVAETGVYSVVVGVKWPYPRAQFRVSEGCVGLCPPVLFCGRPVPIDVMPRAFMCSAMLFCAQSGQICSRDVQKCGQNDRDLLGGAEQRFWSGAEPDYLWFTSPQTIERSAGFPLNLFYFLLNDLNALSLYSTR